MQERLLIGRHPSLQHRGRLDDDCDGDADGDLAPAAAYYAMGDRYEFLLLPEYAASAGRSGDQSGSGNDDELRSSSVVVGAATTSSATHRRLTEWLAGVVNSMMEAQLAGVPLDPPVQAHFSTSPSNTLPGSDRSDASDVRPQPGAVARRLHALRSRASDTTTASSRTHPSTQAATDQGGQPAQPAAPLLESRPTQGTAPATSAGVRHPDDMVPRAQQLARILDDDDPHDGGAAPNREQEVVHHHPQHSADRNQVSLSPKPKIQTTPRKILHDSSSSSSARSAGARPPGPTFHDV